MPISDGLSRKISYLDESKAVKLLEEAAMAGAVALKLNYINEPLLDVDKLIRIAKIAQELGYIDIYMATNGSLLNDNATKKIIQGKCISRIQVSLDALSQDVYEKVRPGGSLEKVTQNIFNFASNEKSLKLLSKIRVNFRCS